MKKDFWKGRKDYLSVHKKRYKYCIEKITSRISGEAKVMDMGSKYLYQSSMLSERGFDVWAYDTDYITSIEEVNEIAEENDVRLKTMGDLSRGEVAREEKDNTFDALVMSEVIEHLAFNPLPMWKSLFRVLKPDSYIFISTPNSLNMRNMVVQTARIFTRTGIGITVDGIIDTPTYGHHWKEYSIYEICEYFEKINIPKENIKIDTYSYRPYHSRGKARYKIENMLRRIGNRTTRFADEIFATVQLPAPKPSVPSPPSYA